MVHGDDSFLSRTAVEALLQQNPEVQLVATCEDGDALRAAIESEHPDVVVTEVRFGSSDRDEGIEIAGSLRATQPEVGVLVLSEHGDPRAARDLLASGGQGRAYLLKDRIHDAGLLEAAIRVVAHGGSMIDPTVLRLMLFKQEAWNDSHMSELTPREREILIEMAAGKSNAAIAKLLVLTKRAVEKHVGAIFLKLRLLDDEQSSRRVAAVLLYQSAGNTLGPAEHPGVVNTLSDAHGDGRPRA